MPEVIIYFNFGKAVNNDFVIGVLSRIIKSASNSSSATTASFSLRKGSLNTLKSYFFCIFEYQLFA